MENPKVVRMSSNQEVNVLQDAHTRIMEATDRMEEALEQKDMGAFEEAKKEVFRLMRLYGISN